MLRSAKVLEKDLIRATFKIKKWKVSHKESHQRFLTEVNKHMLLFSWCLQTRDSQSRGTESCAFYPRSRQLVSWSFVGLSLQCLQSLNWDKRVDSRVTTRAWMAPGGGLVGWPRCRQRDLAFRGLRTNVDSFALFRTWLSMWPGLGYVADLCSGGAPAVLPHSPCWHMGCSYTFRIWQPPLFAGSAHPMPLGISVCFPTFCKTPSTQHPALICVSTALPVLLCVSTALPSTSLYTHHVGVCCFHLLTSPTGGWVPLHPVTPLDKCHLQAKQDSADPNRNETQNWFPNSY